MDHQKKLTDLGIPHLDLILVEIFQIPPPDLFPEVEQPKTLGELAQMKGLSVAVLKEKLMSIREKALDIEVDVQTLKHLLAKGEIPILLDVREPWEFQIAHIPGSLLLASLSFPELLPTLKSASHVVTICHHGVRSFSAAMYLRDLGMMQTQSLRGGVDLWAVEVDPNMVRY